MIRTSRPVSSSTSRTASSDGLALLDPASRDDRLVPRLADDVEDEQLVETRRTGPRG